MTAGAGDGGSPAERFCPGCGRSSTDCAGCTGPTDTWHYCPACGRWLAVQVTPTGWAASCRGCGARHTGSHQ